MGNGSTSIKDWVDYSSKTSQKTSARDIYTSRGYDDKYIPYKIIRESRDNADHPITTPIAINLDVTGSMSSILRSLASKLGTMMSEIILRNPVPGPQIMSMATGDVLTDPYPLQVSQFESDIRISEQLTDLYFSELGGGNGRESYTLAWYFLANKTHTDNFEKRGKKGFLFSFGDDGFYDSIPKSEISKVFGDSLESDLSAEELLSMVSRKYEVYHFLLREGGTYRDSDYHKWRKLLGERAIVITDYTKIPEMIISILELHNGKDIDTIASSWTSSTSLLVKNTLTTLAAVKETSSLVEF